MNSSESVTLTPCQECPWRIANQGRRDSRGFYTRKNLTRLWNQIRNGGGAQSCHPTYPSHPDHRAKLGSVPRECPGSVVLIYRELQRIQGDAIAIDVEQLDVYWKTRKKGLSKTGVFYWLIQRVQFGGMPLIGATKLPDVDINNTQIGLPVYLQE